MTPNTTPSPERAPTEPSKESSTVAHELLPKGFFADVRALLSYSLEDACEDKLRQDFALALDRFRVAGVREERERCFTWAIGRIPRSRAIRAIREGESPGEVYVPRDPSLCWRCGVTLHPGHDCSGAFP